MKPGDKVAFIGNGFYNSWARLARVKIVAELPAKDIDELYNFWASDDLIKSKIMKAFADTDATAVVAEKKIHFITMKGWQKIGDTNYLIYFLSKKQ